MCQQILLKIPNMNLHENLKAGESRCFILRTDMTNLTIAFRKCFANAPKKNQLLVCHQIRVFSKYSRDSSVLGIWLHISQETKCR